MSVGPQLVCGSVITKTEQSVLLDRPRLQPRLITLVSCVILTLSRVTDVHATAKSSPSGTDERAMPSQRLFLCPFIAFLVNIAARAANFPSRRYSHEAA